MSTRAVYSFFGDKDDAPRHVYKHSDGYPTGAAQWIEAALEHAWTLPRYENDEFAAAFVAANKQPGGQIRLIVQSAPMIPAMEAAADFAADAEYRYEVRCVDGELYVKAFATNFWGTPTEEEIWSGPLKDMRAWAEAYEKAQRAA